MSNSEIVPIANTATAETSRYMVKRCPSFLRRPRSQCEGMIAAADAAAAYRLHKENRMQLVPGATNTLTVVVDESMTADRFGNTGVQVLATPMLVSYFELAAHQLAMRALEPGHGTVGSRVEIRHLAATPVGMRVSFRATLTERDGRRLVFRVEADDERERVGEGTHERFIVDMARFMGRIAAKEG
jgi:fluoroacetyl-CoA thioesterase